MIDVVDEGIIKVSIKERIVVKTLATMIINFDGNGIETMMR